MLPLSGLTSPLGNKRKFGLEQRVERNAADGRLQFTTDVVAVHHGTPQFIGVGTPPDEDGSADLQFQPDTDATCAKRRVG
ncbi:hypothetical protein E4Q08_14390 [Candidatus Accumulibacter phosphatis]|uniref:UDP-glucose/GDP-mannose dehydrogenase N-terminal domain-containing protein n=1 Tax=Candidatus Accumulibacter contiguus TaxID=2954381 RepID=A0ABX1TCW2_9PROT|nr:hypothetical protein [Candidatus Accumulibacter contiguus]